MPPERVIYYLTFIPCILGAITFHEFAHARVALAFGDTTAERAGRVTLNPFAHLDPIGFFAIIFIGFGWGRPVPVNPNQMRYPKADLVVSAAGPATNLLLAALVGLVLRIPGLFPMLAQFGLLEGAQLLSVVFIQLNLMLACFNFLPIGALDGAHMLQQLLPPRTAISFDRFNRSWGSVILVLLIVSDHVLPFSPLGVLVGRPVAWLTTKILGG